MLEAALAAFHLLALLAWVVFLSSQTALCRVEWLNEAVVRRLARVDAITQWALAVVLATGGLRLFLGAKGMGWYLAQPLMHIKLLIVAGLIAMAWGPSRRIRAWQRTLENHGNLPDGLAIQTTRRQLMRLAHLMIAVPVLAVLLVRGIGGP